MAFYVNRTTLGVDGLMHAAAFSGAQVVGAVCGFSPPQGDWIEASLDWVDVTCDVCRAIALTRDQDLPPAIRVGNERLSELEEANG